MADVVVPPDRLAAMQARNLVWGTLATVCTQLSDALSINIDPVPLKRLAADLAEDVALWWPAAAVMPEMAGLPIGTES